MNTRVHIPGSRKVRHGTPGGYTYYGCRCPECRFAHATAARRYRAVRAARIEQDQPPHGKLETYNNYGCRCELCRQAKRESRKK